MNRRGFFDLLAGIAATAFLDPEKLLWRPGARLISVPNPPRVIVRSLIGMSWHLSKSDPRKVYDSYHNMVCVCQNAEQARLIVVSGNESQLMGGIRHWMSRPAVAVFR